MRSIRVLTVLTLGTLAMLLAGCSKSPVAPETSMSVQPGAETNGVGTRDEDPVPQQSGGTSGTQTASFVVGDEGVINVGRFTLTIHKNSITMPTTFMLHVADANATEVQVVVTPPEANVFSPAVELSANVSDLTGINYDTATLFSWENGSWQPVDDASAHANQQNVVGRLHAATTCKLGDLPAKKKTIAD